MHFNPASSFTESHSAAYLRYRFHPPATPSARRKAQIDLSVTALSLSESFQIEDLRPEILGFLKVRDICKCAGVSRLFARMRQEEVVGFSSLLLLKRDHPHWDLDASTKEHIKNHMQDYMTQVRVSMISKRGVVDRIVCFVSGWVLKIGGWGKINFSNQTIFPFDKQREWFMRCSKANEDMLTVAFDSLWERLSFSSNRTRRLYSIPEILAQVNMIVFLLRLANNSVKIKRFAASFLSGAHSMSGELVPWDTKAGVCRKSRFSICRDKRTAMWRIDIYYCIKMNKLLFESMHIRLLDKLRALPEFQQQLRQQLQFALSIMEDAIIDLYVALLKAVYALPESEVLSNSLLYKIFFDNSDNESDMKLRKELGWSVQQQYAVGIVSNFPESCFMKFYQAVRQEPSIAEQVCSMIQKIDRNRSVPN